MNNKKDKINYVTARTKTDADAAAENVAAADTDD
jgi:hypothetical protein